MKKLPSYIRDSLLTAVLLILSFLISLSIQRVFGVEEMVTTVFVFAVFLISLVTEGYAYGIVAAFVGTVSVNYAFTFPYFALNFTIPVNLFSALIMIVISVLTSTLTTQIKRHEAVKAESERERMRANLLRAVSHDLRTPLTTIYGSATTMLEGRGTLTEEQELRIIGGIKEDSEWLIRMVENLLSVTRIGGGSVKLLKTPTVLEELIDSVILKFRGRYPEYPVALELPEEMVVIPMDALLVEQVLVNLLENAVRHADGMTELKLTVSQSGDHAVFEVRDNGCGIPADRLLRIFDGYYVSDRDSADSQKKNAGIGLSVCATIIHAHGGTITAENDGGAVFTFTLDL